MGRTIPSFRIAGAIEESKWKPFRALLRKKDRKLFDDMLRLPRLYNSCCMMVCRPVVFHLVIMSILFHHYKQLQKLTEQQNGITTDHNNGQTSEFKIRNVKAQERNS